MKTNADFEEVYSHVFETIQGQISLFMENVKTLAVLSLEAEKGATVLFDEEEILREEGTFEIYERQISIIIAEANERKKVCLSFYTAICNLFEQALRSVKAAMESSQENRELLEDNWTDFADEYENFVDCAEKYSIKMDDDEHQRYIEAITPSEK